MPAGINSHTQNIAPEASGFQEYQTETDEPGKVNYYLSIDLNGEDGLENQKTGSQDWPQVITLLLLTAGTIAGKKIVQLSTEMKATAKCP